MIAANDTEIGAFAVNPESTFIDCIRFRKRSYHKNIQY